MRISNAVGLLVLVLALGGTAPSQGAGAASPGVSVDFRNVPLREVLATLADMLSLEVDARSVSPVRVTMKLEDAPAEVVIELLAWQSGQVWFIEDGVLYWGAAEELPRAELARHQQDRAKLLERGSRLLGRLLDLPLPFRLRLRGARLAEVLRFLQRETGLLLFLDSRLAEVLRFLQRETGLLLFLDSRCRERFDVVVRADFKGLSTSELLDELTVSVDGEPGLAWTTAGEVVVISSPAYLHSLAVGRR